jgi:hypothetical protein
MITVKIGEEERHIDEVDPQWINQQINARRADGQTVCVRVTIREGEVHMTLSTPTCGSKGPGGRQARPKESQLFDLWNQRGLDEATFTGGSLVAFLNQLKNTL